MKRRKWMPLQRPEDWNNEQCYCVLSCFVFCSVLNQLRLCGLFSETCKDTITIAKPTEHKSTFFSKSCWDTNLFILWYICKTIVGWLCNLLNVAAQIQVYEYNSRFLAWSVIFSVSDWLDLINSDSLWCLYRITRKQMFALIKIAQFLSNSSPSRENLLIHLQPQGAIYPYSLLFQL